MISLNTLNQINQIMTVLDNTKKTLNKVQGKPGNFAQAMQQATVQTPAQIVQQTTIKPNLKPRAFNDLCCMCENPAITWISGKPYCKEHKPEETVNV